MTFKLQCSLQFETEVHLVNDLLSILEYYCGCTVAVGNAAKNHSNLAWNVCRKKAAQIYLVEFPQLEDTL